MIFIVQEKRDDSDFDFNLQPISENVKDTGTASKNCEGDMKKSSVLKENITNEPLQIDKPEQSEHIMSPQVIRVQPLCSDTRVESKNKEIEENNINSIANTTNAISTSVNAVSVNDI